MTFIPTFIGCKLTQTCLTLASKDPASLSGSYKVENICYAYYFLYKYLNITKCFEANTLSLSIQLASPFSLYLNLDLQRHFILF